MLTEATDVTTSQLIPNPFHIPFHGKWCEEKLLKSSSYEFIISSCYLLGMLAMIVLYLLWGTFFAILYVVCSDIAIIGVTHGLRNTDDVVVTLSYQGRVWRLDFLCYSVVWSCLSSDFFFRNWVFVRFFQH